MSECTREFLKLFNDLETALQKKYHNSESMSTLLNQEYTSEKKNPVKSNWELVDIARKLRNLLVHETTTCMDEIATPSEKIMEGLRRVVALYQNPMLLNQFLKKKEKQEIVYFRTTDSLANVLTQVRTQRYAQFPIFDKEDYAGMLTTEGIAGWLADVSFDQSLDLSQLDQVSIASVLAYDETQDKVGFIHQQANLYDLLYLFESSQYRVVLVCRTGDLTIQEPADILGVLTSTDVVAAYQEMED